MQTTAIRTVASSLPQNEVILLTLLISERYIPYADLQKIVGIIVKSDNGNFASDDFYSSQNNKQYLFYFSHFPFFRKGGRKKAYFCRKETTMENTIFTAEMTERLLWILAIVVAEYFLVLAAAAADLASGLRKARRRGETTRSRALRRTVDKLARYYNVLIVLTVVDAMQITAAVFLRTVESYDVPTIPIFTLIGSLGMAFIEVKSIFEKGDDKEKQQLAELVSLLETIADNDRLKRIIEKLK